MKDKLGKMVNAVYDPNTGRLLASKSRENFEIFTKSSDDIVIHTISMSPLEQQNEFRNRYGKILANYTSQLIAKLDDRLPVVKNKKEKMAFEELNHLKHACECVVWCHFDNEVINEYLEKVRTYFNEMIYHYSKVTTVLWDALTCCRQMNQFSEELAQLTQSGRQHEIEEFLKRTTMFPKKLKLSKIQQSYDEVQTLHVDTTPFSNIPQIINFINQAKRILEYIPQNFQLWYASMIKQHFPFELYNDNGNESRKRGEQESENEKTGENKHVSKKGKMDKLQQASEKCFVLMLLKWILEKFKYNILNAVECATMPRLKSMIYEGHHMHESLKSYVFNKSMHLPEESLTEIVNKCRSYQLRLPLLSYTEDIYNKVKEWKEKANELLHHGGSMTTINELYRQYREFRVIIDEGDQIRAITPSLRLWTSDAAALLENNDNPPAEECWRLLMALDSLIDFELTTKEHERLCELVGITVWKSQLKQVLEQQDAISKMDAKAIEELPGYDFKQDLLKFAHLLDMSKDFQTKECVRLKQQLAVKKQMAEEFFSKAEPVVELLLLFF
ncbi:hypothetical protein RFI_04669 [Reticulomyxa filosa]|uniref:Uncharacterized protein n=1 Tax=Reticulomyxa filosa TaxID=46433 RepID=X6P2Z7_RETFI|nr:hypothetical protein RFI_04669 [Reticulomyxa filosa]|eukprot:ETO32449.1 hypothetical protein RFI_04669 [Reticulomyxa filosa]